MDWAGTSHIVRYRFTRDTSMANKNRKTFLFAKKNVAICSKEEFQTQFFAKKKSSKNERL
jgi:hypothetical protein